MLAAMSSIPIRPLEVIREALASMPETGSVERTFTEGQVLMKEGERYEHISLVVSGEMKLSKRDEEGLEHPVGRIRAGQFLGLLLLSSGEPSFLTARVKTAGKMLSIHRDRFIALLYGNAEFNELVGPLLLGNLVHRYRRVVHLHLKVAELTQDLEAEKRRLELTIQQLETTRNQLIQQEKMATLGQLVAGIAHEINNPIASLSRAADSIEPQMFKLFESPMDTHMASFFRQAFQAGLTRKTLQTEAQRTRIGELEGRFPDLPRPLIRSLAQIDPEIFDRVEVEINREPQDRRIELARRWVEVFEAGILIRNMRVASARIGRIVGSLKGYSRQDKAAEDEVDLREGLNDTLILFGYVLKKFRVEVDLPDIPLVHCHASELNQVWTNLVLNACQAMGDEGTLRLTCGRVGERMVWVNIQDTGAGRARVAAATDLRKGILHQGSRHLGRTGPGPGHRQRHC